MKGDMKPSAVTIFGGIVGALLTNRVLAHAVIFGTAYTKIGGVTGGLMCGFFNWLGFIAPVTVASVIYDGKPWSLWLLGNGFRLVSLLVMGIILAVWK